jgi:signal transduction histidine kinase
VADADEVEHGVEQEAGADPYAERLHRVIEAGVALNAELSLDDVLQRILESAASLTQARFAALGVIDPRGSELERFVTHGVDDELRRTIGELPRGRGILGALIRDARPLRLDDLHRDPRSVGFPPGHPPMTSFLGVPIFLRRVAYGNLYLTEKAGGADFTEEDERLIQLLAAQAAVAIENARLYESSLRWARQLESLAEVSKALANEYEPQAILSLVSDRIRELVGARFVYVSLQRPDGRLEIVAASGDEAAELVGRGLDPLRSKSGAVMQRGRGERVDSMLDDVEADRALAQEWGIRAAIFVPLLVRGGAIGAVAVNDRVGPDARFSESDYRLVQEFADRAAIAIDLSQRVQRETVSHILRAQELERQQIARELHDETGQALTAILLGLKPLETSDTERAESLRELVKGALASVRKLSVDLRPAVLDDFGLVAALERFTGDLRERTGIGVHLSVAEPMARLPADVETMLFRIAQEAVGNAIRHGEAHTIHIRLVRSESRVALTVADDGRGFDPDRVPADRFGLLGMRERAALVGGALHVESATGEGARITAEAPIPAS